MNAAYAIHQILRVFKRNDDSDQDVLYSDSSNLPYLLGFMLFEVWHEIAWLFTSQIWARIYCWIMK